MIFQCSMDKTWCRLRKAFIVHIWRQQTFYQLLNSSFLASQLLQSLLVYISSLVANIEMRAFYKYIHKLKSCIDMTGCMKNQELETHFIYQQNDINFCLHTLMLKYVTPTSRNVRSCVLLWKGCLFIVTETDLKWLLQWISFLASFVWFGETSYLYCSVRYKCNYFHSNCHL